MMKTTYKAGVLFCGGCNSRYDRLQFYQSLAALCAERSVSFDYYEPDQGGGQSGGWDGCGSECLLGQDYPCPVVLLNNGGLEEAVSRIDACLVSLPRHQPPVKGSAE